MGMGSYNNRGTGKNYTDREKSYRGRGGKSHNGEGGALAGQFRAWLARVLRSGP